MAATEALTGEGERAAAFLLRRHRFRAVEALPWAAALGAFFLFPDYLALGTQILIMALFALSLDLILGFAGIVTLGHATFSERAPMSRASWPRGTAGASP